MRGKNKVLFIAPYFPTLPYWIKQFERNVKPLEKHGFRWLIPTDLDEFRELVNKKLNININLTSDNCKNRKISDFTPALGLIYSDYLKDYEYWGHTDIDIVMGRLDRYLTDEFLKPLDIFSDDLGTVNGAFSVYRNSDKVNNLFKRIEYWEEVLTTGDKLWAIDEHEMSDVVKAKDIKIEYREWHSHDNLVDATDVELKKDGTLIAGGEETMWYHFNHKNICPKF